MRASSVAANSEVGSCRWPAATCAAERGQSRCWRATGRRRASMRQAREVGARLLAASAGEARHQLEQPAVGRRAPAPLAGAAFEQTARVVVRCAGRRRLRLVDAQAAQQAVGGVAGAREVAARTARGRARPARRVAPASAGGRDALDDQALRQVGRVGRQRRDAERGGARSRPAARRASRARPREWRCAGVRGAARRLRDRCAFSESQRSVRGRRERSAVECRRVPAVRPRRAGRPAPPARIAGRSRRGAVVTARCRAQYDAARVYQPCGRPDQPISTHVSDRHASLPQPRATPDHRRGACRRMAVSLRGCDELLPEADWLHKLARVGRNRRAAAHQARPRPDRARPAPRPHGGAQQDAPAAGPGPHGDLPDRRLHVDDRRPVGPQHHAPAADARADRGQRQDLLRAGQPGARPGNAPRSATTPSGATRSARAA